MSSEIHADSLYEDESCITNSENETQDSFPPENVPALTPFNMKEELEEGYFDTEGMYHWKKKSKFSDYWLDNLSNYNLQKCEIQRNLSPVNKAKVMETCNYVDIYKKILCYLQPAETISQALRRLGKKNSLTTLERLRLKKRGMLENSDTSQQIMDLTGLVNIILTKTGDVDIYQNSNCDIRKTILALQNDPVKSDKTVLSTHENFLIDMFEDDTEKKSSKCIPNNSN